ncbi:paired amphipathic helix [Cyathus striatus]|nr:paired amphipathic helix [Cyathus striatus]
MLHSDLNNNASSDVSITDALNYLDAIKIEFHDQPAMYRHFADILKGFKDELIDTLGVIGRVAYLFSDHPALIHGFNTFLPVGYRIYCSADARDFGIITITTPTRTTTLHSTSPGRGPLSWSPKIDNDMELAVQYVKKIKQRCDPYTYRQFLDVISRHHHQPELVNGVS